MWTFLIRTDLYNKQFTLYMFFTFSVTAKMVWMLFFSNSTASCPTDG